MITLHYLADSRGIRIAWLLEELGLDYSLVSYDRNPQTYRAPKDLRAIHPLGKSPIVVDGEDVLTESAVVIERLLDRYGEHDLRPAHGTKERHAYDYWLHYAEGSLMPNLVLKLVFTKMPMGAPAFLRPLVRGFAKKVAAIAVDPELKLHLGYIEDELGKRPYLAGNAFTAADIQMLYPLIAGRARSRLGPNTSAYLDKLMERPAFKRASAKIGKVGDL